MYIYINTGAMRIVVLGVVSKYITPQYRDAFQTRSLCAAASSSALESLEGEVFALLPSGDSEDAREPCAEPERMPGVGKERSPSSSDAFDSGDATRTGR